MSFIDNDALVIKGVFSKYTGGAEKLSRDQFTKMVMDLSKYSPELKGIEQQEVQAAYALFSTGGMSFANFNYWWRSTGKFKMFTGEKGVLLRKAWTLYKKYALRDSQIDLESFMRLLDDLHIKGSEEDFDKIDVDDNGLLNFKEFSNWLQWF
jgi:hypothetical protein